MDTQTTGCDVYLTGDPVALRTSFTVDYIRTKMLDAFELAGGDITGMLVLLELPLQRGGLALVRVDAITAVVAVDPDEDDD